jgi:hypothetical protein
MRILIDEDTAVQLVDPLRCVLVGHGVAHVADLASPGPGRTASLRSGGVGRTMDDVGSLHEAEPVSRATVLTERYRGRLPETLDELTGPGYGTVRLPAHVAWSGLTAFDVDRAALCISMYQVILTEGLREDLAAFLNRGLLVRHWPVLRTVIGRVIRDVWEAAFQELADGLPVGS